jgi:hypothetical protein
MNVPYPYLHPRLPDSLRWRVLGALIRIKQAQSDKFSERTNSALVGALGAMNLAAAIGVSEGRESIVASLIAEMVADIEAIAAAISAIGVRRGVVTL